ncbi:MAG: cation transporter dimerization domain-containing protein, partial [Betaproteobacteria bacterium]
RKSGSDRFIDLHLVVSKKITVDESHGLADRIEAGIKGRFPRASVMIHVEPCKAGDECESCKGVCKDGI